MLEDDTMTHRIKINGSYWIYGHSQTAVLRVAVREHLRVTDVQVRDAGGKWRRAD